MNKEEAINYNVEFIKGGIGQAVSGTECYNGETKIFGIIDRETHCLAALLDEDPQRPLRRFSLTEMKLLIQEKPRGVINRISQAIRNKGRSNYRITSWAESQDMPNDKPTLSPETREILEDTRRAYNEKYGFIC